LREINQAKTMLKTISIKSLPEICDLIEAFGHASDPRVPLRHLTITLTLRGLQDKNPGEAYAALRDFIRDHAQDILDTFNKAGVICCTGLPMRVIGKVYPRISVWVREQDLDRAGAAILAAPWAESVRKDDIYHIGDSLQRSLAL
jgi:hypothetical protein